MNEIIYQPIGIIYTEFENKKGIPIQSTYGEEYEGTVILDEQYLDGLADLQDFSHIHLIYHFNQHQDYSLKVRPYMDDTERGLFATRAPKRPNGIGLSLVKLIDIDKNIINFRGVDMLNNTPLLDIKPYYSGIDHRENVRSGWLDKVAKRRTISDDRF